MHPVHNGGSTEDLRMRQDPSPSRCIRVKVQLTHPLAVIHPTCMNISIFFLFFYFISASAHVICRPGNDGNGELWTVMRLQTK